MIALLLGFFAFAGIIIYSAWASARHADKLLNAYFQHKEQDHDR